MKIFYSGPAGTGKTHQLKEDYNRLLEQGHFAESILVLVRSNADVQAWRNQLKHQVLGQPQIYTFFGFIQRELMLYWPQVEAFLTGTYLVEGKLGQQIGGKAVIEPTFMTVEAAHYLMGLLVDKARGEGKLATVLANNRQIAIQLIDNLNHGAMNALSLDEMELCYRNLYKQDTDKTISHCQALDLIREFRRKCLQSRCLDYSLVLELFGRVMLGNGPNQANQGVKENFNLWNRYREEFPYVIVDNLEETIPAAQDFIKGLLATVKGAYLAYNPEGGYSSYFGADPKSAEESFPKLCDSVKEFTVLYNCNPAARSIKEHIATDLRGDMFQETVKKALPLLLEAKPGEIAFIAPAIDKVMEFCLQRSLQQYGFEMTNLTRNHRLVDEPFVQGMVTLALLANPEWQLEVNYSALVQTFSLILELDPVRSALLADAVFRNKLKLPVLDDVGLRSRIGFDRGEKYDYLRNWISQKEQERVEIEVFFQQAFGELLAPLLPKERDLMASRQLIDSVLKLRKVLARFPLEREESFGQSFIQMVQKGTLAADYLFKPPQNKNKVILATPNALLFSPHITSVKYQFWLDVSSPVWLRGSAKELVNPYVLSRLWDEHPVWNDEIDQKLRKEQLVKVISGLLSKCTGGVYLASSHLSSQGWEQESDLVTWLEEEVIER